MNIQRISTDSAERICASQVIPNLHSCVRELVENALDALSESVCVRIRNSGDEIEVVDNGSGIEESDWCLLCLPHATSKLQTHAQIIEDDIQTHGFRGEALAALCVLSREMRVITRTKDSVCGSVLSFNRDGNLRDASEKVSKCVGSTVTVHGLYRESLPVRHLEMTRSIKKGVKTIKHLMTELAIMHFSKKFELIVDGKFLLNSAGGSNPYEVYKRIVNGGEMEEFNWSDADSKLAVSGWVTPAVPSACAVDHRLGKSNEQFQVMYINGKPMDLNKKIVKGLVTVYSQYNIQKVSFILMLRVKNNFRFDRNASVDKRAVLFSSDLEDVIVDVIANEVKRMFDRKSATGSTQNNIDTKVELRSSNISRINVVGSGSSPGMNIVKPTQFTEDKTETSQSGKPPMIKRPRQDEPCAAPSEKSRQATDLVADGIPPSMPFIFSKVFFHDMNIVGQFNNGFIITKLVGASRTDFFLIDQHAANEKFLFEQYYRNIKLNHQPLISPISLKINPSLEEIVIENIGILGENGFKLSFDTSLSPGNRLKLVSLPALSGVGFNRSAALTVTDLMEIIDNIDEEVPFTQSGNESTLIAKLRSVRAMFASKACRSAVMVGDSLTFLKMTDIVTALGDLNQPWNCPHGRPTLKHILSLDDLRKLQ